MGAPGHETYTEGCDFCSRWKVVKRVLEFV
jgi:hypothetical protein